MTKGSDNHFPSALFDEQGSAPSTPSTGDWRLYFKSDGLYILDDAGASTGPLGSVAGASWQAWSPTISGGATAIGNGTEAGRYATVGDVVHAQCKITWGSTSNFGGGSSWIVDLPVAAAASNDGHMLGSVYLNEATGGGRGVAHVVWFSGTECLFRIDNSNWLNATNPWTWATSDYFAYTITYEKS